MSTSIIYHGFGAVNYHYKKTEYQHGALYFQIRKREKKCSFCGSFKVTQKGTRERVIRTVPIGKKQVFFKIENRRLFCRTCGALRHEELEIADPKKQYDRKLERFVAELCQVMTIKDVARHVDLSWNTVKDIDKRRLQRERPTKTQFKKIRYLGVDEVAIRKGHRYLTICVDLDTGTVVYREREKRRRSPAFSETSEAAQGEHSGNCHRYVASLSKSHQEVLLSCTGDLRPLSHHGKVLQTAG